MWWMHFDGNNPVLVDHPKAAFNAFLMMRFEESQIMGELLAEVRASLARYAINVLRADQRSYADSLWNNVRLYMDACDLGIAIFSHTATHDFNPNVSLELGYMMASEKRVLLLKDRNLPRLHSDLVGHLYRAFDPKDVVSTVQIATIEWLRDIGIAKSPTQKLVLFVSDGGTCRCAMSKIVAQQAFAGRSLPFALRFESMAATYGNAVYASNGARQAIQEAFGQDLLQSHRVMRRNPGIIEDADLILVMEKRLAGDLPAEKTRLITELFGECGEIQNPWPDFNVGASDRYRDCLAQLRSLIEPFPDRLLQALVRAE
ncbi:MAG TPA: hypothetical protein VH351_21450 [Bryobacteraceae bacterium]|jgi:nucleoside 2-deoxyribosyltransferase|nr:hypothetical protein [Bryobacteraceae bacterium]